MHILIYIYIYIYIYILYKYIIFLLLHKYNKYNNIQCLSQRFNAVI